MIVKFKLILFFVFLSFLSPAYSMGEEVNFGPLFRYDRDDNKNETNLTALGPFFIYKSSEQEVEYGFRPLFYNEYDYRQVKRELDILYPLAGYIKHHEDKDFNILFFINYKSRHTHEIADRKFEIFPLLFTSFSGAEEDNYFGLFPLYGNLKNKFHKKSIKFVLFPLFLQTKSEGDINNNILWPFFGYQKGDGVEGFKFWPFYGHKKKKQNDLDEKFVLWPFYLKRQKQFYDEMVTYESFLPFYSELDSKYINHKTYLWPFFSKYTDRNKDFERIDAPWPVFNYTRGEKTEDRIFPFYAKEYSGADKDGYIMWPLYSYSTVDLKDYRIEKKYYMLLFLKDVKEIPKNLDGKSSRRIDFWPLVSYKRDRKGNKRINALSILEPFLPDNKPIKNNFQPFWTLYNRTELITGEKFTNLLWNIYRSKSDGNNKNIKISPLFPLFEYDRTDNMKIFKFFGGIIDIKRINVIDTSEIALLD